MYGYHILDWGPALLLGRNGKLHQVAILSCISWFQICHSMLESYTPPSTKRMPAVVSPFTTIPLPATSGARIVLAGLLCMWQPSWVVGRCARTDLHEVSEIGSMIYTDEDIWKMLGKQPLYCNISRFEDLKEKDL